LQNRTELQNGTVMQLTLSPVMIFAYTTSGHKWVTWLFI